MAHCANCSAPLPENSIRCDYCGSRNDVDLKGVHYYTTHETDALRTCPRCASALKTVDLQIGGRFLIERCEECLGLFFDPGELEAVLQASVANVFTIDLGRLESLSTAGRTREHGITYLKCPVCATIMNRVNFGAKSGTIVDRCKDHGVWLDGGELRHLCEWMKAGGKLLEEERQERLNQEREREERRRTAPSAAGSGDATDIDGFGEILQSREPDLFDIVVKVARFFNTKV